jgi:hypothetical protein
MKHKLNFESTVLHDDKESVSHAGGTQFASKSPIMSLDMVRSLERDMGTISQGLFYILSHNGAE